MAILYRKIGTVHIPINGDNNNPFVNYNRYQCDKSLFTMLPITTFVKSLLTKHDVLGVPY